MAVFTGLGSAAAPSITFSADTNTGVFSPNTDQIAIATAGTQRLVVDASGNVGIGTASPGALLDVRGTTSTRINLGVTGTASRAFLDYTESGFITTLDADGDIRFSPNNTEAVRITTSGRLGIGTTSPGYALDVAAADTTASTGYAVRIRANATAGAGSIQFTDSAATVQYGVLVFGANGVGTLQADGASSRLVFSTNATERLRIDTSGNVGIGISTPGAKLDLAAGGGSVTAVLIRSLAGNANGFQIVTDSATDNVYLNNFYNAALRFGTNNTEKARIDSSGRVLIGTSVAVAAGVGLTPFLQLQGTGESAYATIGRWSANTDEGGIVLTKSRGAAVGTVGVVQANDGLGEIVFSGDDGTNFIRGAIISSAVDGTPGTNDMPGRLVFSTTADGAASPTERMRINNAGTITFNAYGAGTLSTNGSGVISASDGRYKTKTRQLENGLEAIAALEPTYYRWNEGSPFESEYEELGFVAQEVAAVIPEASPGEDEEGKYRNYHDRAIIAMLVKGMQEQQSIITALTARVAALEAN